MRRKQSSLLSCRRSHTWLAHGFESLTACNPRRIQSLHLSHPLTMPRQRSLWGCGNWLETSREKHSLFPVHPNFHGWLSSVTRDSIHGVQGIRGGIDGEMKAAVSSFWFAGDGDSLLNQTLFRLLSLLLGPSVYFLVKFSVSKNPAKCLGKKKKTHPQYLITLIFDWIPHLPPPPKWCLIILVSL